MSRPGHVALVGAGPGDPGLLTLRGLELLREADVVFFDRLVSPEILELIPKTVERRLVGKTAGRPEQTTSQEEIHRRLLERARQGETVVRLKGGDPFVFGRGFEELEVLEAEGVVVEVVPGLTSALAGAAAARIPATHRELARSVSISTPARSAEDPVGGGLTGLDADTVCLLMPLARIESVRDQLLESGRPADTPAALVERATWPEERTVRTTLARLAETARSEELRSPTLVVVGEVVGLGASRNPGPLLDRRLLITRPRTPARTLRLAAEARGARTEWAPLISVRQLDEARWSAEPTPTLSDRWQWVVFTSLHGVHGFFAELGRREFDARAFGSARIAAVGPKTAAVLATYGVRADLVARPARAEALVRQLTAADRERRRALFARGTLARESVPRGLRAAGFEVDTVDVYRTDLTPLSRRTARALGDGRFDAILLYSPSAVESLRRSADPSPGTVLACVGPTTSQAARAAFPTLPIVEPNGDYGDAALLDALEHHWHGEPLAAEQVLQEVQR